MPKGQKVALIGLPGSGGPPRATLTGPSGRTIRTPAAGYEKTPDYVVISDNKSATKETYFFINHPEAGAWKVDPRSGLAGDHLDPAGRRAAGPGGQGPRRRGCAADGSGSATASTRSPASR